MENILGKGMKDIFGEEIKLGQNVIYIQSKISSHFEKAAVVECGDDFIRILYLGVSSYPVKQYCKIKGKKGRITATEKRIAIMEYGAYDNKKVHGDITKRFHETVEKIEKKLQRSLKIERKLIEENKELRAEVNKIHDRFDILDL
jgi:hypothetical protein